MKKYRFNMLSLNLETTRRCNLKCLFCARGHAQNMDMSPVVIDTTLDQLQKNNVYVESLRLNGGEPFLAPDSIEYSRRNHKTGITFCNLCRVYQRHCTQ